MASSLVMLPLLNNCHADQEKEKQRKGRGIFRVVVMWLGPLTVTSDVGSGSHLSLEQTCGSLSMGGGHFLTCHSRTLQSPWPELRISWTGVYTITEMVHGSLHPHGSM